MMKRQSKIEFRAGDWLKFDNFMFVKFYSMEGLDSARIQYKRTIYTVGVDVLKKVSEGEMMLWKLENPNDEIG
jgi:hypothetical protein